MNFHHLHYFREVIRHEFNMSRAAEVLYVSQPALSKAISEMEEFLGGDLFVRAGKKFLGLTELGQAIFIETDSTLTCFERVKRVAQAFHYVDEGSLTLACTHTQAKYRLPNTIVAFKKKYPKVRVSILQGTPSQIAQWILSGRADIGIASEVLSSTEGVEALPCYEWSHLLIAPMNHILIHEVDKIELKMIAQYPLVVYDRAFAARNKIDRAFADKKLEPNIVLEAMDADIIKTYVEIGLGLGIIPEVAFDERIDRRIEARNVGHLFGSNRAFLAVKKNTYLYQYSHTFIEMLSGNRFNNDE
jgi:LysR family cys regulon transcriptional activator